GWDIGPGATLTPYGTYSDGTMQTVSTGIGGSWGSPVVSPDGDIYIASDALLGPNYAHVARLSGGLWNTGATWTKFSWPNPTPAEAFTDSSTYLFEAALQADPNHGIFNSPSLAMSPSGVLYMCYVTPDPNYLPATYSNSTWTYSQAPFTHVYVVSCTNPTASSPIWGTPVAVDTDTNVTEFL